MHRIGIYLEQGIMRMVTNQVIRYFPLAEVLTEDCAQRKPTVAERWSGAAPLRVAVRSMMILLFHEPPRTLL